jgi:hypothetical protein
MNTQKIVLNTTIGLSIILSSIGFNAPAQAGFRFGAGAAKVAKAPKVTKPPSFVDVVNNAYTLYGYVQLANGQVVRTCQKVESNGSKSNPYRC